MLANFDTMMKTRSCVEPHLQKLSKPVGLSDIHSEKEQKIRGLIKDGHIIYGKPDDTKLLTYGIQ